jgi:lysozyme
VTLKIGAEGLALIKSSEGLRLRAYPDPGTGGAPWTIGYGHTGGVRPGDTCSEAEADAWLLADVAWAEDLVNAHIGRPMTQGQFDAFASFAFNVGPGRRGVKDGFVMLATGNPPTMRRAFNAGDWRRAADEFPKWANPPLAGLVVRRARERNLFLCRDWRAIPDADVVAARRANAVPA